MNCETSHGEEHSHLRTFAILLTFLATIVVGQDSSSLSGSIIDPSGAAVPGAKLTLFDSGKRVTRYALTNDAGLYSFDALVAGDYTLLVAKEGFRDQRVELIRLTARDTRNLRLQLEVVAASGTSITVTEQLEGVSTDISTGSAMGQKYVKDLPVNGRDVNSLVRLAPGVVSGVGPDGGINANGLRSNTNYYTVDGVSANTGIGGGAALPGPLGSMGAAMGSSGSMVGATSTGQSNLISMDAMQEIRVQTSAFAPEYGRSPGAQVSILSRGGGNNFHGSLFGYFRNQRFNANDWFANRAGLGRAAMRQGQSGGVLGGRLIPNKTYFFASFERNSLAAPQTVFASVPSTASRQSAPANLRQYLNAFPVANGALLDDGAAQFSATYSNPSEMWSGSLRLDHVIRANMTAFARYSRTPSSSLTRGNGFSTANTLTEGESVNETLTGSWVWARSAESTNDLRVNYTRGSSDSVSRMDNFGRATPLDATRIFPAGVTAETGSYNLTIQGLGGYQIGRGTLNRQQQINIVDAYSRTSGTHQYKMGIDYRRLSPTYVNRPYSAAIQFNGLGNGAAGSFLSGRASNSIVTSNTPEVYPLFQNLSAYWQDSWKATDRTTVTYGVRWDVNPAPTTRSGDQPFAVSGDNTLVQDKPMYGTRWFNFAPRVGVAYQMDNTPDKEMMFRGGLGVFYDVGNGSAATTFTGAPFANVKIRTQAAFPLTASDLAAPGLPAREPYGQVSGADNGLLAPRIWQWQMNIERYFGRAQSLEVAYSGTKGQRMATVTTTPIFSSTAASFNDATLLRLTTNGATSDYHGLNVQYRRRFSSNLQMQTNYTWSHAIDDASNDVGAGFQLLAGSQRGSSNFDVRHNFNMSGAYKLPGVKNVFLKSLTNTWWLDFIVTARSGLPFDIQSQSTTASSGTGSGSTATRVGFFGQGRPEYNGLPVYVTDANAPGGRRLNKDAFSAPTGFAQGDLGRNAIRGFGQRQVDFTLRREVAVREGWRLQLRLEAYNVLNQANFANPNPLEGANLASPNFGVVTRMGNAGFGSANVYGNGGPRSMQAAIRLEF
jgi:hypothetical protein